MEKSSDVKASITAGLHLPSRRRGSGASYDAKPPAFLVGRWHRPRPPQMLMWNPRLVNRSAASRSSTDRRSRRGRSGMSSRPGEVGRLLLVLEGAGKKLWRSGRFFGGSASLRPRRPSWPAASQGPPPAMRTHEGGRSPAWSSVGPGLHAHL